MNFYGMNRYYNNPRKLLLWVSILLIAGLFIGCANDDAVDEKANTNGIAIPLAISALAVPGDTTSFTASLYLDGNSSPLSTLDIAQDGSQTTVNFTDISVPVGTHTFTIEFILTTVSYGELKLATATHGPVDVSAESSQSVLFDINDYNFPDDDNDSVSNLEELTNGTNPIVAESHTVSGIKFSISSPAKMDLSQRVHLEFNYNTNQVGGVRIWANPRSNGANSPNAGVCGSPLYAQGVGNGTCFFTITSGAIDVDELMIQMWTDSQTALLYETILPVKYRFAAQDHVISNVQFTPGSAVSLANGADVSITFDYKTTEPGGVRIWARPFSNGSLTPNYSASGSVLHPVGAGVGTQSFTIRSGAVLVDHIRFEMWTEVSPMLLQQYFYTVDYSFGGTLTVANQPNENSITVFPIIDQAQ